MKYVQLLPEPKGGFVSYLHFGKPLHTKRYFISRPCICSWHSGIKIKAKITNIHYIYRFITTKMCIIWFGINSSVLTCGQLGTSCLLDRRMICTVIREYTSVKIAAITRWLITNSSEIQCKDSLHHLRWRIGSPTLNLTSCKKKNKLLVAHIPTSAAFKLSVIY